MGKVYVGATLALELDCELDVSSASSKTIALLPPDGVPVSVDATLSGTQILVADLLLHQAGDWRAQTVVVMAGKTYQGETLLFEVTPRFR